MFGYTKNGVNCSVCIKKSWLAYVIWSLINFRYIRSSVNVTILLSQSRWAKSRLAEVGPVPQPRQHQAAAMHSSPKLWKGQKKLNSKHGTSFMHLLHHTVFLSVQHDLPDQFCYKIALLLKLTWMKICFSLAIVLLLESCQYQKVSLDKSVDKTS